jgi:hypothetical protein
MKVHHAGFTILIYCDTRSVTVLIYCDARSVTILIYCDARSKELLGKGKVALVCSMRACVDSGGKPKLIFYLCTDLKWVVKFTPVCFVQEAVRSPLFVWNFWRRKNFLPFTVSNLSSSISQHSVYTNNASGFEFNALCVFVFSRENLVGKYGNWIHA